VARSVFLKLYDDPPPHPLSLSIHLSVTNLMKKQEMKWAKEEVTETRVGENRMEKGM
jgi:hypothetical protein